MIKIRNIFSGTLLIAGTTIGAGMLGIPLVTAKTGFVPGVFVTVLVWLFMYLTGLCFLEATLWMHRGANLLSMSRRFLGRSGRMVAGFTFVFLYYCLLVAYFSAGAPILGDVLGIILGISFPDWASYFLFFLLFGFIVGTGLKWVDRINYLLMIGVIVSYLALIGVGHRAIQMPRLFSQNWNYLIFAAPILFSSFGYHNIIPSLVDHFGGQKKVMHISILLGTLLPLLIYIVWQWLILGAVPNDLIVDTLEKGEPITYALEQLTGLEWITRIGQAFGFFAVVTSMLGVSFSIVDFLGDGLNMKRKGLERWILCGLTFVPPLVLTAVNPSLFVLAIGIAGGIGEALLNGIIPVLLVWVGRYKRELTTVIFIKRGKITLGILLLAGFFVMAVECYLLVTGGH